MTSAPAFEWFGVWSLVFGVWCLGFGVWGLGSRVCDLGFRGWSLGFGGDIENVLILFGLLKVLALLRHEHPQREEVRPVLLVVGQI